MDDRSARQAASSVGAAPHRLAVILAAAALAVVQAGCGGGGGTPTCTVNGVTVSASPATIASGGTSTLSASLDASAACSGGLTWSATGGTLTPGGATASFTSTAAATHTITATSVDDPTKKGTATVTVIPPATCTVNGITVSASPASIPAGAPTTLSATLDAIGACSRAITWEATGGTLTPSGATARLATSTATTPGDYVITATSVDDPTKKGSATVTVAAQQPCVVTGVIVSASPTTIPSGGTSALSATLLSSGSCSGAVSWTATGGTLTPNGSSATFTSTTATATTYTITATSADDTGQSGSATVTVNPAVTCTVTSVGVTASPPSIAPGFTSTLTATLTASAGCNPAIDWTLETAGGTLTPNGISATFTSASANTYTIKATSVADPTKFASATVTVLPSCTVTGVTVSASPAIIPSGGTSTLSATLNASVSCSTGLNWTLETAGGTLTPNGTSATFASTTANTYTIRATSVADPTKFGTVTVTVTAPVPCTVTSVTVSPSQQPIPSGGTATLTATLAATAGCNTGLTWSIVAPSTGGTLTPNRNSATFTSTTQTTFTIRATSVADTSKSGDATVTVGPPVTCGQTNGTEIIHRGDIVASETWAGDGVTHRVAASVDIRGTAVVTVEACAVVLLAQEATISTHGSARLVSAGTGGGRTVTFTSVDGQRRWGLLIARSPTSLIDLRWTTLREGGEIRGIFFDTTLAGLGAGYGAPPAKVLRVINVDVEGSSGIGVYLDQNAAFTDDSEGLTVRGSGSNPVYANMMSLGSLPIGSYTGNARKEGADEIQIRGNGDVFADMTVKDLGVPYSANVASVNVRPLAPATAPVTLTLQPGVTMKFPRILGSPGALVTLGNAATGTVGVLNAVGTAAPIVFTSGQAVPAPGDWAGLWLANAPGSRLDNVQINFAGAPNGITSTNCRPAGTSTAAGLVVGANSGLYVPAANLVTNSSITSSAGHGINANWLAATVSDPVLTTGNTFTGNLAGTCSQTFNGLTAGTCPSLGCTTP